MPVVAVVGGERVEAWTFDASAWEHLRRTYRTRGLVMSCGQPGEPVRSPRGLLFFRHKRGADCQMHDGGDESQEHFTAKALVAETARDLGWTATVERRSDDGTWIADVLLEHAALKRALAVEVQWSRQSNADFHRRQDRYTADGVDCLWIIGPVNAQNVIGVPSYPMAGTVEALTVTLPTAITGGTEELMFADAIALVLNGLVAAGEHRLSPIAELTSTALIVEAATLHCWNEDCGRPFTRWRLTGVSTESRCGHRQYLDLAPNEWIPARAEPAVAAIVTGAIAGSDLPRPATYEVRYLRSSGEVSLAQFCPYCSRMQTDRNFTGAVWARYIIPHVARVPFRTEVLGRPHRCSDVGRGHCLPSDTSGTFPPQLGFALVSSRAPAGSLPPRSEVASPEPEWITPRERKRQLAEQQAKREQRKAERAIQRAERERVKAERAAAEAQALREAATVRCSQLEAEWPASELRVMVLKAHGGVWPEYLDYEPLTKLVLPAQMWQAQLWNEFIRGRQHLTSVDPRALCDFLVRQYSGIQDPANAVREWLLELQAAGVLSNRQRGNAPARMFWTINPEMARREAEERAAVDARMRAARDAALKNRPVSLTPAASSSPTCVFCRYPLDPIYEDLGYHPVCSPGWCKRSAVR